MTDYEFFLQQRELEIKYEKRGIKNIGIIAGACVISSIAVQYLIGALLLIPTFYKVYMQSDIFQSCFLILTSIISIGIPFGIGGIHLQRKTGTGVFKFGKPNKISLSVLSVPFGFFVCLVANYITSINVSVASSFGIKLTAPESSTPSGIVGRLIYIVSTAVVPALVEELAIRGTVMQPLRKYGDKFAIVVSAVVFAIIHGNLIQAPFAFIAGLAIGYTVCLTNSLWTGVMIHFANNFYYSFIEFLIKDIPDVELQNRIYFIIILTLLIISIIGSVCFMLVKGKQALENNPTALTSSKKAAVFFLSPAMIIAILIMINVTLNFISFK